MARLMTLIFPLAALVNSFSMIGLLLIFGVIGDVEVAADIGIVQAATLALFYAFSANARYLILSESGGDGTMVVRLLRTRLMLLVPLAGAAWYLSVGIGGVPAGLAAVLIVRRSAEWMGEIGLARLERMNRKPRAMYTLVVETTTLVVAVFSYFALGIDLSITAIAWALAPMIAVPGIGLGHSGSTPLAMRALLPHFGSTATIGASVYVFRISIALLVGKAGAGALFTAFAIGSLIPTIFAQALAPTLMHRTGVSALPRSLMFIPAALVLAGSGLAFVSLSEPDWLLTLGHPAAFWLATGLSIVGGGVMLVAATLRARLIQSDDGPNVFGTDLLANLLIATSVPVFFYVLGPGWLAGLYLFGACVGLLFLWGGSRGRKVVDRYHARVLVVLGSLIVLPVFVQIGGGLFDDPAMIFDTYGSLSRLPIPLSVVATFAGIALLGNYASATRTLTTLFFTALLFVMTSLWVSQGNVENQAAKLILLAQFLLPIFGLSLGEMYGAASHKPYFERVALAVIAVCLPLQLAATWVQGDVIAQPKVFFFSIYQHLEYFPMVVSALVVMGAIGLWNYSSVPRLTMTGLLPLTTIHAVASLAVSAFGCIIVGLLVSFASRHRTTDDGAKWIARVAVVSLVFGIGYMLLVYSHPPSCSSGLETQLISTGDCGRQEGVKNSSNEASREDVWRFYLAGALDSPREFLLGHETRPDRSQYPSAQNYWLDTLYNFGVIALIPLIALLITTGQMLWARREALLSDTLVLGAMFSASYLVLVEGTLSVGMRQPYPGIITFFVWGLLLARLHDARVRPIGGGSA